MEVMGGCRPKYLEGTMLHTPDPGTSLNRTPNAREDRQRLSKGQPGIPADKTVNQAQPAESGCEATDAYGFQRN